MRFCLILFIAIAVVLHIAEYYLKKWRKFFVVINLLFHILSFSVFVYLGLELIDLFVLFLSSAIVALLFLLKEVKSGI